MYNPQWSDISIAFYVLLALQGMFCMSHLKNDNENMRFKELFVNPYFLFWWTTWTIVAVYRLVGYGIGGADAIGYVESFENCLNPYKIDEHLSSDIGFYGLTKLVRFVTDDYHIYFGVMYGSMLAMYIYFLKYFSERHYTVIPYFLTFYLYLRSFNTLRSNVAIAFILVSIVAFSKKEYRKAYIMVFVSMLVHKASFIYALVLPFVHLFWSKKIRVHYLVTFVVFSALLARIFQHWFIGFADDVDLGGAYKSYASNSLNGHSFVYVDSFGQWLLAALLILNFKKLGVLVECSPKTRVLWLASIFDVIMVPFSSIMGIWRAYEFLYLVRLSMYSMLLWMFFKKSNIGMRNVINLLVLLFLIVWMIYRISRTYEDSSLLPYVFAPLI